MTPVMFLEGNLFRAVTKIIKGYMFNLIVFLQFTYLFNLHMKVDLLISTQVEVHVRL